MAPDRYGEPAETSPLPPCGRPGCKGIRGYDEEMRPIPCLVCRPHLRKTVSHNDYDERPISERAQAAIEAAERNDL